MEDLKRLIRRIPDFPKPGIVFRDITPLLGDPDGFRATIHALEEAVRDLSPEVIAAPEARGFLFAAPLAIRLGLGLVPIRKPKKLPWETVSVTYDLEYGTDTVAVHRDAIGRGQRVLLVDDLLATGGTIAACAQLVEKLGGVVAGFAFVVELAFLRGREKLAERKAVSLVSYATEEE
ncbi:MAG: adenine phosphoribosyltransferase [Planctomycetes bacterium]|nr:adenine phosphoribosyltransferase [Planctomycetota bacterium]